jgi:multimeric flavodoxin WrbA
MTCLLATALMFEKGQERIRVAFLAVGFWPWSFRIIAREADEGKALKMVLGIYGSPRKAGNTDLMLDAFLKGAEAAGGEIKRLYARGLEIRGCLGCGHCDKAGVCIQKDDMLQVYPLLEQAQGIVVASPIYFYGITAQLKLLVDRAQASYMKRELARKGGKVISEGPKRTGFLLLAGATRGKRLFECSILTVKYFFDALGVRYSGDLCFKEIEERGAIFQHPESLEACRQAGRDFLVNP